MSSPNRVEDFINPKLRISLPQRYLPPYMRSTMAVSLPSPRSVNFRWQRAVGHHALVAQTAGPAKQYTVHMLLVYICVSSLNSIGGVVKLKASNVKI